MRFMRGALVGSLVLAAAFVGAQSVVGTYTAGIRPMDPKKLTPQQLKDYRNAKKVAATGSLKIHKDGSFGMNMAGMVMFGKWQMEGNQLKIKVDSIVGKTDKEIQAMPESKKAATFKTDPKGIWLTTLPVTEGRPVLVWKKKKQ